MIYVGGLFYAFTVDMNNAFAITLDETDFPVACEFRLAR